jgi:hypothetical protein
MLDILKLMEGLPNFPIERKKHEKMRLIKSFVR